jgi:serine/threonine protein kinase
LGAGGMGEVYRARDTRLNRDVAVKVLLPSVANDPDRLARFSREAQVLASLNHPNIAHIYGVEEASGVTALVMELVEGEDLSQRIARGPIPIDEALPIARQIAEALEAAHDHGIIHRDLKPANIKLRADGTVKVLDFGLAKAIGQRSGIGDQGSGNAANSPTLSIHATEAGIILGTAAYMSPEQARGRPVDKRADIWSYGVVVYEMVTGQRAFTGDDVSETLASVLKDSPAFDALPASTPPRLRRILERCLERDPKARLRDIGEARLELIRIANGDGDLSVASTIARVPIVAASAWSRALPWAVAGALALALAMSWAPWQTTTMRPPSLLQVSAELGADVSLPLDSGDTTSLSPDGTVVAFIAQKSGDSNRHLYVRRLNQLQATVLPGTDDARDPFFSPDGEWIGFFARGKLKKIAVAGGGAVTLCDAPEDRGGAWSDDGTIVFAAQSRGILSRVSSAGGTPQPVSSLVDGEVSHRWPQVLPGGKAVLFTSGGAGISYDDASLVVQPLPTGPHTVIQRGAYHGRYLPSGRQGGHLLYMQAGAVFAAPFDLDRLSVTGSPVPAIEGVARNLITGFAQFAVSASGTVVYVPGLSTGGILVHWMDQQGKMTPLRTTPANWVDLRFAPDGQRLAFQIIGEQLDIWVYEWARDTLTRLTFDPALDMKPVWTADGRRIGFASARADKSTPNLYWQRADGTGETERLTESTQRQEPSSWHPSGTALVFEEQNRQNNTDLMILPIAGDEVSGWKAGTPTVFLNTPFNERNAMFSPDGRWVSYVSNESGRDEVYVRPYPGPGGKWQISTGGGVVTTWSHSKRQLFYGWNGQIMVVPYAAEADSFRAEKPRLWSEGRYAVRGPNRMFDLHPDGTRVALAPVGQADGMKHDHITFLFNFFDHVRRIAPVVKP